MGLLIQAHPSGEIWLTPNMKARFQLIGDDAMEKSLS
jgi:hypothetical protein